MHPILLVLASLLGLAAPASHPFSVHDMVAMERLADPRPSPDGRLVVFTRRAWDSESGSTSTHLWLVSIDGRGLRQLTTSGSSNVNPRWSSDGKTIAFLSNRSGSMQIWTLPLDGGEAVRKSDFPVDVTGMHWSPDGTRFAFSAEVYPDCDSLDCTAQRDGEVANAPTQARIYTRLMFRHWDTWEDGKRSHVFVWPGDKGTAVDLMRGLDADSPTLPWGGTEEFAWSPDGTEVALTSKIVENPAWSTDVDIYVAAADGTAFRCLTESNDAVDTSPAYSPDGKSLAWLSMSRPGYEADRLRITLLDRQTGELRVVAPGWDRSVNSLAWSPDGKHLYVTAEEEGRTKIFRIDPDDGAVTLVIGDHHNTSVSVTSDRRLVFARDSFTSPVEIHASGLDGSDVIDLTRINEARTAAARTSHPEEFWFQGAGGDKVHGWLLRPVDFEPGRKYPVALLIHGGPQGATKDRFHYRWNAQAYTGAGYAVVAINFHGSTGYGQAFTDAIRGHWGDRPYEDLMKGLDHVLAANDWVDGDRVCALGASYGGYMTNWIEGQTDRFKCLVTHDGEFDTRMSYYTTEELWFPEWENLGPPWQDGSTYTRWSPAEHVSRWKTPMLVIHGARDFRLVESEAFATFTALQRRGIPSKLLYFPDENHWILKPANSILWHETVIGWLDEWLKKP